MEYNPHLVLEREARQFYRFLFGLPPTAELVAHYVKAHDCLPEFHDAPVEQQATVGIIVKNNIDATAIEPWLRRKERRHLLSAKLLLLVYLFECSGVCSGYSQHSHASRSVLLVGSMAGVWKLVKGLYLKVRYGLV